jgi:hypothetical protein
VFRMAGNDNRRRAASWTFVLRYAQSHLRYQEACQSLKTPRKTEIAAPFVLKPEGIIEPPLTKNR